MGGRREAAAGPRWADRARLRYGVGAVSVLALVVSMAAAVSGAAVSIAPGAGAVSLVMPGLPVSVPAPPAVPASPPGAPPPHAASTKAAMEPSIQDVRFIVNVPFHGGAARVTARVECVTLRETSLHLPLQAASRER
jgi:hypothetical protein